MADNKIIRTALSVYRAYLVDQVSDTQKKIEEVDAALFHLDAEEKGTDEVDHSYTVPSDKNTGDNYFGYNKYYMITVYKDGTATCTCADCINRKHQCKHLKREGLSYHA